MKLPPSPSPPAYDKDRTLTRRTVKGSAGGMLGAHYEDDRRPDAATEKAAAERATAGAGANREVSAAAAVAAEKTRASSPGAGEARRAGPPREDSEVVLEDEDATSRDNKLWQSRRPLVSRDRLTVDKDAPDRERRRQWVADEEDPTGAELEDSVELADIEEAIYSAGDAGGPRAHLFAREDRPEPGEPGLTDPAAIQRRFKSPIGYAKHVMILAEAFRHSTGATRAEALAYLARMFVALPDRAFGRLALKEFGPGTGILDLYPLEVVAHVLERYPAFLPKVGFGRLFSPATGERGTTLRLDAGEPFTLVYPAELKIRGFALVGGGRPGYAFEPATEPGRYRLTIDTAGRHSLLISALTRSGHTILDRLEAVVSGEAGVPAERREEAPPPRDEAKVRAWPIPAAPRLDPRELLDDEEVKSSSGLLTAAERIRRQQLDKARGPKGAEELDFALDLFGDAPEKRTPPTPAPRRPSSTAAGRRGGDEPLTAAEQTLLELAVWAAVRTEDCLFVADAVEASAVEAHDAQVEDGLAPSMRTPSDEPASQEAPFERGVDHAANADAASTSRDVAPEDEARASEDVRATQAPVDAEPSRRSSEGIDEGLVEPPLDSGAPDAAPLAADEGAHPGLVETARHAPRDPAEPDAPLDDIEADDVVHALEASDDAHAPEDLSGATDAEVAIFSAQRASAPAGDADPRPVGVFSTFFEDAREAGETTDAGAVAFGAQPPQVLEADDDGEPRTGLLSMPQSPSVRLHEALIDDLSLEAEPFARRPREPFDDESPDERPATEAERDPSPR